MYYQIIAIQSGGKKKTIINKNESDVLQDYVIPFKKKGVISEGWGGKNVAYQVLELRIYKTQQKWDKKSKQKLEDFIQAQKSKNVFNTFEKKANKILAESVIKVFVVTPIQGKEKGSQEEQRIYIEYNARFTKIEETLRAYKCTAIRIDKEFTIKNLAERIRKEIKDANFIVADLTDERPSCYYEVGFAEALGRPVIFVASENSVINTQAKTKIHFDIHQNINYFTNLDELKTKLINSIEKNKKELFGE